MELFPDTRIGPRRDVVFRITLDVETLHLGRACAEQGEPVALVGVDQFVPGPRRLGEDTEPAKWIDFLEFGAVGGGNGLAAGAVEPVGPDDILAVDRLRQ